MILSANQLMESTLAELELCPLVEIVHFHKVLRGEMMSLVHQYRALGEKLRAEVLSEETKTLEETLHNRFHLLWNVFKAHSTAEDNTIWPAVARKQATLQIPTESQTLHALVEDHEEEEKCFKEISDLLQQLKRNFQDCAARVQIANEIDRAIGNAAHQLIEHLHKEESNVLPFIQRSFTNEEMEQLVGQIMGHRSSDITQSILSMMVRHLSPMEREHMLKHMHTAVKDTYFERWMSLLNSDFRSMKRSGAHEHGVSNECCAQTSAQVSPPPPPAPTADAVSVPYEMTTISAGFSPDGAGQKASAEDELTAAIKAIAKCEGLSSEDKTRVMQCLRMSHSKRILGESQAEACQSQQKRSRTGSVTSGPELGQSQHPWSIIDFDGNLSTQTDHIVCLPTELSPSHHTSGGAFGCSHYARNCRLAAPCCNRFFVCRLCHEESSDHSFDRYAVKQVLCMHCNTLQPSGQQCQNPDCTVTFARYYCGICHLFDDDESKSIYHCPYCNVCRKGKGLGIDYYHCMRCNACIRIEDEATHSCLSHSMERSCPICQRYLFDSVDMLKGLKCGHVMHLDCFMQYRIHKYYCPLCHQTMEDMSHEWDMIDNHLRTTGLPAHLTGWKTKIHCHDCTAHTVVQYRLDYHKCPECSTYNTRTEGAPWYDGATPPPPLTR